MSTYNQVKASCVLMEKGWIGLFPQTDPQNSFNPTCGGSALFINEQGDVARVDHTGEVWVHTSQNWAGAAVLLDLGLDEDTEDLIWTKKPKI